MVSPLIDGEDSRKGKAVTKEWDEWKVLLPHVDVGLLHGRMSSEEKEAVMKDFRSNRISVLVSTTVVEVDDNRECRTFRTFPASSAPGAHRPRVAQVLLHFDDGRPSGG